MEAVIGILIVVILLTLFYFLALYCWLNRQKVIMKRINKAMGKNKLTEKKVISFLKLTNDRNNKMMSYFMPVLLLVRSNNKVKIAEQNARELAEAAAKDYPHLIERY